MDLALAFEDSQPFKLTVDQYRAFIEQSVIDEGARVELIEGMVVRMNSQASVHTTITFALCMRLHQRLVELGSPLIAMPTPTVDLRPHNLLDPDVAVTLPAPDPLDFYPASGVRLLVEVSRTTLRKDMKIKRDIYARAGVPEYWVVDVRKRQVHRFWRPVDGVYRAEPPVPLAGDLASLTIPDLVVDGAGIL